MAKTVSKFKTFTLELVFQTPKEFESDNVTVSLTTAKSTTPKEFNPHTFNGIGIPYDVYFEVAVKEKLNEAYDVEILGLS